MLQRRQGSKRVNMRREKRFPELFKVVFFGRYEFEYSINAIFKEKNFNNFTLLNNIDIQFETVIYYLKNICINSKCDFMYILYNPLVHIRWHLNGERTFGPAAAVSKSTFVQQWQLFILWLVRTRLQWIQDKLQSYIWYSFNENSFENYGK